MKALVVALCGVAFAGVAQASPCAERIAALQSRYDQLQAAGAAEPAPDAPDATAPESTAAKLHRQPTAASVAHAETKADTEAEDKAAHFQIEIEQARAAEDSGDVKTCEAAAAEAEKALSR